MGPSEYLLEKNNYLSLKSKYNSSPYLNDFLTYFPCDSVNKCHVSMQSSDFECRDSNPRIYFCFEGKNSSNILSQSVIQTPNIFLSDFPFYFQEENCESVLDSLLEEFKSESSIFF